VPSSQRHPWADRPERNSGASWCTLLGCALLGPCDKGMAF
jgi:hypothetical protein